MEEQNEKLTQSYVKIAGKPFKPKYKTLPESLLHHAMTKPNEEAIIFVAPGGCREAVRWSELYNNSHKVAKSLIKLGVKRHEVVAVNVRPCPQWLYATFGAMMAGAIPAAVSFTFTDGSDLVALMDKMKTCSLLIVDPGLGGINWGILKSLLDEYQADGSVKSRKMPYLRYLLGIAFKNEADASDVKNFEDLLEEENSDLNLPEIQPNDITGLFQTSGSTGVPKLIAYEHGTVMKVIERSHLEFTDPNIIVFNDRPFTWGGGYPFSLITGQRRVAFSGFADIPDPVDFMIDVIEKEKCSAIFALPPLLQELISRQGKLSLYWPVEYIMTGGQPLSSHLAACIGKSCKKLVCVYAGTEFIFGSQAIVADGEHFHEYGCGKLVKYPGLELKIVDGNGQIVPVNQRGEIYIRSDALFKEYYNDPEKTKAAKTEDGWYKTGDLGRFTEDGELFVEGRKSNMIISGGFNVAPEIMEKAIKNCPGVESVIIVPVPDKVNYQVLCACVLMENGYNVSEEKIRKFCKEFHADKPGLFTVLPKFYMLFKKFPETNNGKTNRMALRRLAVNRFKSTGSD